MKLFTSLSIALAFTVSLTPFIANAENNNFRIRAHQEAVNQNTAEDIDAEIEFGKTIGARILGQYPVYNNEKLIRYVNLVGRSLAINSNRSDIDFFFTVLDADFINAYSTPGGYVFITRGAIAAMQNEAELAAVLAHEVAHIAEKHIVKEFKIKGIDNSATAGLSQLLGSASSSAKVAFSQAVDNAVNMLLSKGFKHEDEMDADRMALLLMASTGYDPMALGRYLERIKAKDNKAKNPAHKPTHPPTSARITALKKIAKEEGLDKIRLPVGASRFAQYAIK
jgi:predicted Zn-dependent protease